MNRAKILRGFGLLGLLSAFACAGTPDFEGKTWHLVSYGASDDPQKALEGTTAIFLRETDEGIGRVGGSGGCNRFNARYTVEGAKIEISAANSTMMYCGTPGGIMDQERAFLNALSKAESVRIEGGRMIVVYESSQQLAFEAAETED